MPSRACCNLSGVWNVILHWKLHFRMVGGQGELSMRVAGRLAMPMWPRMSIMGSKTGSPLRLRKRWTSAVQDPNPVL